MTIESKLNLECLIPGRYSCPCCEYFTREVEKIGSGVICPVCYWKDDLAQYENPNFAGTANIVSLNEARQNFKSCDASEYRFRGRVRPPQVGEYLLYPCSCCGYLVRSREALDTYEICPICFWEDDASQVDDPASTGGANTISLSQARENFKKFGACEKRFMGNVRPPRPEEIPG